MLRDLIAFIDREKLFTRRDKILLAVSGGRDSVALAHLLSAAGYRFGIAHCNFHLRGKESDEDEIFVRNLARKLNVPFFCRSFDITGITEGKGFSVQMAARELRYSWFGELREKEGYDFIATAHHLDDQIETFFINLLRSSGISGFHGILPRQGFLVRPLLFAYRSSIDDFLRSGNFGFREDSSNQEMKYLRNRIRHEVLPALGRIQPEFRKILTENIGRVAEADKIFGEAIGEKRKKIISREGETFSIPIRELLSLDPVRTYAYELLSPFGFNFSVIQDIIRVLEEPSGKQFFSATHWLVKDREKLIIRPAVKSREKATDREYYIREDQQSVRVPLKLRIRRCNKDLNFRINTGKNVANFDLDKLEFPLVIRKWRKGDAFYPFGKDHRKKVSDFFIDEKLSLIEKENCWLLCSGKKIAWIIGHRIDNRFRITGKTVRVLQVERM